MYDPNCHDLAEHFLDDETAGGFHDWDVVQAHRARVKELAQAIQDAIEAWLEDHRLVRDDA
jgi:hypothetical protein